MVFLEAAAITAGGIAAYKGGEATVNATSKKAKAVKQERALTRKLDNNKSILNQRKKDRQNRMSTLQAAKGGNGVNRLSAGKSSSTAKEYPAELESTKSEELSGTTVARSKKTKKGFLSRFRPK
mmetsp:Transcript_30304/g.36869  ORF Transcript_30304/g.36869 Transcript_30304/m.36869 type:complete len:124 (-) Transcript_30304:438-809(-)